MSTCAIDFTTFDRSIPATTDLFAHVNGGWAKRTEIPDDKASWGAFHELREASEEAVRQIIADLSCADRSTLNGEQRAIADLYASFMDTETISSRGLNAIQPYVDKVNQISSMDDLARHLGWSARHGLSGLIDIDNDADPADPTRYILFIGQSGISLPDEEYYRLDEHESIRVAYRDHVEAMLSLCAFDHADDLADRIVALETKIAAVHWDKVRTRDMVQMYHPQSWQDLCASTHFNWELFRQAADLPNRSLRRSSMLNIPLLPMWIPYSARIRSTIGKPGLCGRSLTVSPPILPIRSLRRISIFMDVPSKVFLKFVSVGSAQ